MILAAGRGTRLGALGETTPKALIEVGGVTMLERTARTLVDAGADPIVVNVHHHAEAIERFLATHALGAEMRVSREEGEPYETGGGLRHARERFAPGEPVLVHNVDVICDTDLRGLLASHTAGGALATLAVQARETQRHLLFDDDGLFGREDLRKDLRQASREPRGELRRLAFAGVHVCEARMPGLITERGVFPIVEVWLRLAAEGHAIRPWLVPEGAWYEIGNPERLAAARARFGA